MRIVYLILSALLLHHTASAQPISELLNKLKQAPADTNKVPLYVDIIKYYQYIHPDSATYYVNEGLKLSQRLKYRIGEAKMYNRLGAINEAHGSLNLAKKYLDEALAIFKEANYTDGVAGTYNGLGIVFAKKGDLKTANEYFLNALKLYKSVNNIGGTVQAYIKLGAVNDAFNNFEKALEYFREAEKLNSRMPISDAYFTLSNNVGILYAKKGDFKQAIKYFKDGVDKSDTPRFAGVHVALLVNIGNAYEHLHDKKTALEYLNRALVKTKQYDLPEDEARTLLNIASVTGLAESQKTFMYLDSALHIAKATGQKQLIQDVYEALADDYEEHGRFKEAYWSLREYNKMKDSLYDIAKAQEIANLQANFELEESKVQIQSLQLSNQKRTFERNIGIAIITATLTVLFTLWFALRRTHMLNKKLKESNAVKDKLFSIIGHDLKGPMAGISQMMSMIEGDDFSPDEQKEIHQELRKQSEASLEILNSLLNWGNIQLQGVTVNPATFNAGEAVRKTIALLKAAADVKVITITNNVENNVLVNADPDHFDFVIRNLVSNAIKFTHLSGDIEINAQTDNAGDIVFSVKDNGIGISEERQKDFLGANINVSFGTNGEKGTGLGLLLSKEFIQHNNGKIWLESAEGQGTTFYFSLKRA